mgnify:CR=1 FL=1
MCQFKSLIVTRTEIFHDLDVDSHEELIKAHGFNDKTTSPDFVRVEYLPVDGNIFNHDRQNWKLSVDQDFRPDWFSGKEVAEACWPFVEATFKARFLSSGRVEKIEKGRWFLSGTAEVGVLWGNSQVGVLWDCAILCGVYSSAAKWTLKEKAVAIIRYETPTRIVTAEKGAKLEIV